MRKLCSGSIIDSPDAQMTVRPILPCGRKHWPRTTLRLAQGHCILKGPQTAINALWPTDGTSRDLSSSPKVLICPWRDDAANNFVHNVT